MKKRTGEAKKTGPKKDRAWFERKVAELKTELEKLPAERQEQLRRELEADEPERRKRSMAVYKRGEIWWYKFTWNGEAIRESTKQTNKRIAEQMEATHKGSLAKGEVGIREKEHAPTLKTFLETEFMAFTESRFKDKPNTLTYYRSGLKAILAYAPLAESRLDALTAEKVNGFVVQLRESTLQITTMNRQLQVLRRAFKLAEEWGQTERVLPRVRMLPGESRRERVLTPAEESAYCDAARVVGDGIEADYRRALEGIRAVERGQVPVASEDPHLLRDVTKVLMDCGLRPEECYRLRWEHVRDGALQVRMARRRTRAEQFHLRHRRRRFSKCEGSTTVCGVGLSGADPERAH